jgi:hypothetical protein
VFLLKTEELYELLGRADYGNAAAKVKVVVVERSVKNTRHSAADGQQQHGQGATAQIIIVVIGLRIRNASSCTLASSNLLNTSTGFELRHA